MKSFWKKTNCYTILFNWSKSDGWQFVTKHADTFLGLIHWNYWQYIERFVGFAATFKVTKFEPAPWHLISTAHHVAKWEENCYFDRIVDRSNTLQNNFSISIISGVSFRAKHQLNTCAMIFAQLWLCFCCLHQLVLYSLLLLFFVWEIFKFKYDRFFVRHSASISEFKWFDEEPCSTSHHGLFNSNVSEIWLTETASRFPEN